MPKKGKLEKELLVTLYSEQMMTMAEVGRKLDRCPANILYWLRKYGIPSRHYERRQDGIKYHYNTDFFKVWSPEMAWVLGLMFSDGCVSRTNKNSWSCTLHSIDDTMLLNVAQIIGTDAPLFKSKTKSTFSLSVGNTLAGNDLIALGCTPKKSRTMKFPDVPTKYASHFVRGLWDGDGCIFERTRKRKGRTKAYHEITLSYVSGSKEFVKTLAAVISHQTGIVARMKERKAQYSPYYVISYYHRNSLKLLPWLYGGSTEKTRLARKYRVIKELV